jgi:hypothetical protein
VAFQTQKTIGDFFPYKDKVKDAEAQSLVVYKIKCDSCDAEYIGKTERILCHRVKEHRTSNTSACYQHTKSNPGHKMNYDGIEIIDRADNNMKLQIKELLHILKQKPTLNKQLNSQSSYDIKTIIVKAYQQFRESKEWGCKHILCTQPHYLQSFSHVSFETCILFNLKIIIIFEIKNFKNLA